MSFIQDNATRRGKKAARYGDGSIHQPDNGVGFATQYKPSLPNTTVRSSKTTFIGDTDSTGLVILGRTTGNYRVPLDGISGGNDVTTETIQNYDISFQGEGFLRVVSPIRIPSIFGDLSVTGDVIVDQDVEVKRNLTVYGSINHSGVLSATHTAMSGLGVETSTAGPILATSQNAWYHLLGPGVAIVGGRLDFPDLTSLTGTGLYLSGFPFTFLPNHFLGGASFYLQVYRFPYTPLYATSNYILQNNDASSRLQFLEYDTSSNISTNMSESRLIAGTFSMIFSGIVLLNS